MKDRTKLALAKALQELLNTKSLDEVRVSELCSRCNLQRQSFYYHFQDKYDLVAWIFMQDTSRVFAECGSQLSLQFITNLLNTFYDKKQFYLRIIADRSQNLPLLYIKDYVFRFCMSRYQKREHTYEFRAKVKFLVYGSMGVIWEWLQEERDFTANDLAQWMFEMIPDDMKS